MFYFSGAGGGALRGATLGAIGGAIVSLILIASTKTKSVQVCISCFDLYGSDDTHKLIFESIASLSIDDRLEIQPKEPRWVPPWEVLLEV